MAAKSQSDSKQPGFFSQLKTLFRFTKEAYGWLPWVQLLLLIGLAAAGVLVGFLIPPAAIWSIILWGISGLMVGFLASVILMTRLSTRAMYRKIDGLPGAVGRVLSSSLGRKWVSDENPVGINPKSQDAVYRAVGRGGVVIVGEGSPARLTRLINEEKMKVNRVANGVTITVLYVGHGEDQVPLDKLVKTVKSIPKSLDKATMNAVLKRVESISRGPGSLPIPKGIDPNRVRASRPR